jgi:P4 family phage/plasmid primase-like protien
MPRVRNQKKSGIPPKDAAAEPVGSEEFKDNGEEPGGTKAKRRRRGFYKEANLELLLGELPPLWFNPNTGWHVYNKLVGCYHPCDENAIGHRIQRLLPNATTTAVASDIKKVKWERHFEGVFYPGIRLDENGNNVICLNNKVIIVDMKTGEWAEENHDPKWMFSSCLPIHFDKKARCPTYDDEIKEKLSEKEDIELWDLFGAYVLLGDCRLNCALILYGAGDTGKSTLAGGLAAMLGTGLTSSLTLHQLCPPPMLDKTSLPQLRGVLLNLATELNEREIQDSENLKRLITGEEITAREAFGRTIKFRSIAKHLFLANAMPVILGTDSDSKRFRMIHMRKQTEKEKLNLLKAEMIASEASGIFLRHLKAFRRLLCCNMLPLGSEYSQEKYLILRERTNPWGQFVNERCEIGPGYYTPKFMMFAAIRDFWDEQSLTFRNEGSFMNRIVEMYAGVQKYRPRRLRDKRQRGYEGIKLKKEIK